MAQATTHTIIPDALQQHIRGRLRFLPILWIDSRLTRIDGALLARDHETAAGRARRAAERLRARNKAMRSATIRDAQPGEIEGIMVVALALSAAKAEARKTTRRFVTIRVAQIEFVDGGNTIWIHGHNGGTVLRIKCREVTKKACTGPIPHADITTDDVVSICVPGRKS